jgi:hypothetical protein
MCLNGQPLSYLLAFQSFEGSHTGQSIADAMQDIMAEYHVQGKTRFIVTDNASNMRKAMTMLFNLLNSAGPGAENDLQEAGMQLDDPSVWLDRDD